jgi:site-specific DNA-methyltransferase (adenine-specific)
MELNKIYNTDCIQGMKTLPDKSIDLIITDPPYGVGFKKSGEPYLAGDNVNLLPIILPEFYRVLKDDGAIFIFSSTPNLQEFLLSVQMYFKMHNIIIWDKINPIYPKSNAHFRLQFEPIIYASKGLHYLQSQKCSDIIQAKIPRGNMRFHPTQKPVEVIDKILFSVEDKNQIVLDPFMGSGSTAISCIKNKKKYIGFEINNEWYKKSLQRIENEFCQTYMCL